MQTILHNGYIVAQTKSLFTQDDIAVIVTGVRSPSTNPKTGPMLQVWVIPTDDYPSNIAKRSVTPETHPTCNNCPLRDTTCYVNLASVNQVYKALLRGKYPKLTDNILSIIRLMRRNLRITAYGEATAVPFSTFEPLLKATQHYTGYTHTWQGCDQRWKHYIMASVETEAEAAEAQAMGWRTFRILAGENTPLQENEVFCKNHTNPHLQCNDCLLCSGSPHKETRSIAIPVHGHQSKQTRFAEYLASVQS